MIFYCNTKYKRDPVFVSTRRSSTTQGNYILTRTLGEYRSITTLQAQLLEANERSIETDVLPIDEGVQVIHWQVGYWFDIPSRLNSIESFSIISNDPDQPLPDWYWINNTLLPKIKGLQPVVDKIERLKKEKTLLFAKYCDEFNNHLDHIIACDQCVQNYFNLGDAELTRAIKYRRNKNELQLTRRIKREKENGKKPRTKRKPEHVKKREHDNALHMPV